MRGLSRAVWVMGALSASLAMGYGVLFTIVADFRDEYGISETAIGWLIGVGFIAAFFAQTLIAPIADRGHARRVILIGVSINVLGLVGMAFGETLGVLMAGRIVSGLGIGAALPAIRRIVILTDTDNVGENLGRLLSADVFGFAMGPAVSALLVSSLDLGLASPFITVAGLTIILLVPTMRLAVEETIDPSGQRLALDLLSSRVVAGAVVLAAGVFLMIGAFDALWDVVHEDLETPEWMANLGITLFAIPLVILGPTGGRLAQRIGPFRVAATGLVFGAFFIFMYGQLPSGSWIFGFAMFHAVSDALTISGSGVAVAMAVPEERQAGAQGLIGAAQALTGGITAGVIGGIYEGSGRAPAYTTAAVAMLVVTAIGMWLAADFWRNRTHELHIDDAGAAATTRPRHQARRPKVRDR